VRPLVARALLVSLVLPGSTACLQGDLNRARVDQPLVPAEVDVLRAGGAELTEVLARLGAPRFVRELSDGIALAYGWSDGFDWNIEAQVPVGDAGSFQFTYASAEESLPGVVVFLDSQYHVRRIERGVLRQLLPERARPRLVEAEAQEAR
jgi:hypothetical protein